MTEIEMQMQRLLDKQAITEILYKYARGCDRCDRAILASTYWPEAVDDHLVFTASGETLLDHLCSALEPLRTVHSFSNILIEFASDREAYCESHVLAYHNIAVDAGREEFVFGGRFLDRLAKRNSEWRFANRRLVMDYFQRQQASKDTGESLGLRVTGGHYPADPIYSIRGLMPLA